MLYVAGIINSFQQDPDEVELALLKICFIASHSKQFANLVAASYYPTCLHQLY